MMYGRRLLAGRAIRRRLLSSMPHENKSGSGSLLLTGVMFGGITFGAAYAVEHKYVSEDMAENLTVLSPVQDLLRQVGLGYKDVEDESIAELYKPIPAVVEEKEKVVDDSEDASTSQPKESSAQKSEGDASSESAVTEVAEESASPAETPAVAEAEEAAPVAAEVKQEETHSSSSSVQTDTTPAPAPSVAAPETPSSSFASDSEKLLSLRVHALDRTLSDISADMTALQSEAELALAKDLQDLDVESLRKRIVHLNAELLERIRWEGLRQQQVVQAAEAQFAQQYGSLLTQQRSELLVESERRVFEKEKVLINSYRSEIDDLKRAHEKELSTALAEQQKQLMDLSVVDMEKAQTALQEDMNQAHSLQMAMVKEQHVKNLLQVQNDVSANNIQLAMLRDAVKNEFDKTCVSHETHALSAAVLLMERALLAGKSVKAEVAVLKNFAAGECCDV
jgi:hypothetical protein